MVALGDQSFLGVPSSRVNIVWAKAVGGTLEDRPCCIKSRCFEILTFQPPSPNNKPESAQTSMAGMWSVTSAPPLERWAVDGVR